MVVTRAPVRYPGEMAVRDGLRCTCWLGLSAEHQAAGEFQIDHKESRQDSLAKLSAPPLACAICYRTNTVLFRRIVSGDRPPDATGSYPARRTTRREKFGNVTLNGKIALFVVV